jgi:heme/copper-type cytochrome/quinol oxidase subunit 3
MRALITKEIKGFLGSLIGHIVIVVFLLVTGLFLWVFPDNILDQGYADLGPLFFMAPWVFLFLVPAVTMRSFSEERRTGTLEILLTKPLTELQIVLAKYVASLVMVVVALLPTLVYWYSLHELAVPRGNLDTGGILGSYAGLLFLAACFVAIGTFAQWAVWAAKRNDRPNTVFALGSTAFVGLLVINAQAYVWSQIGVSVSDGAYGSMFFAITGTFVALMIVGVLFSAVTAFRYLAGRTRDREILAAHAIYWYTMSAAYAAIWFVVYVTK